MFTALAILLVLTVIAAVFTFGLFSAPTFGGANVVFYFLLGLFVLTLVLAFSQQVSVNTQVTQPAQSDKPR